jgi:iron(III) transport system permease protein
MATITGAQLRSIERKKQWQQLLRQPGLVAVIILLFSSLAIFSIYPLLKVFASTVWHDGVDLSILKTTLGSSYFKQSFWNSVFLGAVVAVISGIIGFVFAFATTRTNMGGKKFFHLIAMLPIVSPPFVLALALILLCGRSGLITRRLLGITNANVYGMHSLVFVQVLGLFPLAYLNMKGILESLNTSVEDAARSLGAGRGHVFRTVTLPLCIPALLSSFLIVFIKSISDFGNPQILGGNFSTLSSQAYLQINGMHNLRGGALIAISILFPSIAAFVIQKYWVGKKSFISVTGKPVRGDGVIREKYITVPLFVVCGLLSLLVLVFYGMVVWIAFIRTWGVDMSLTLRNFAFAFSRGGGYIRGSFLLSIIATPVTAMAGMLIAWLVIRKEFPGKGFIEFATILTFAVPGIVLGISYILAFNQPPFLLTGSAAIIIITLVFRHLSVGIEAGTNSLRQIDPSIEEASANLGAGGAFTFWHISLPMMKSALYISLVNTFVRSMTSISAVIFVVSVNWNLLTVLIMSEVEGSRFGVAAAYCVILMVIVLAAFALMQVIVNRIGINKRREPNE